MNLVIALACAVEPLARRLFLPPQGTEPAAEEPDDDEEPPAFALDELELLSLPQPASSRAPATRPTPTVAPERKSFT